MYNSLSPSGMSFCLSAHMTYVTPLEPSTTCSHDKCTYSARVASVYFASCCYSSGDIFFVVAPARHCPGSLFSIFVVIHSWPATISAMCAEHVCEWITLFSSLTIFLSDPNVCPEIYQLVYGIAAECLPCCVVYHLLWYVWQ